MSVLTAGRLKSLGLSKASLTSRAIIGQRKHSVLPEPVPVDTNKSFPSKAPVSALT